MSALDLTAEYSVRYRNHSEDLTVFRYDRGTRLLLPNGYDEIVHIERQTDREAWVFGGNEVLYMDDQGLIQVRLLSARPRPHDYPRLDFCREYTDTPEILASLHVDGRFCIHDAFEQAIPNGDDQMIFYGLIAFNRLGLYAATIEEQGNLLTDEQGNYFLVDTGEGVLRI